jgi:hypothetical protein
MRKQIPLLLLLATIAFFPYLNPAQGADIKTDLILSTGYRADELNWNIAGNILGSNPNVLSELNGSVAETRLNEVNWDAYALMLGLVYRFGK